jgi:hypothetical protein
VWPKSQAYQVRDITNFVGVRRRALPLLWITISFRESNIVNQGHPHRVFLPKSSDESWFNLFNERQIASAIHWVACWWHCTLQRGPSFLSAAPMTSNHRL